MSWQRWLGENWFEALQTLLLFSGFIFTCITLRRDEFSRRVSNRFDLTANHLRIWQLVFLKPELHRVISTTPDLDRKPITDAEKLFVGFLVQQLRSAYQAIEHGLLEAMEGLGTDIRVTFSYPVVRAAWGTLRKFQDEKFVRFVEDHWS